ncbi:MAG: hypothetical protein IT327_17010 [Anaerolineae bacterium]|nr:hypothetical protein [Anaerolineae bacterium]
MRLVSGEMETGGLAAGKALANIARTTLENVKEFEETGSSANLVSSEKVQG